jgi:hypothetical protein
MVSGPSRAQLAELADARRGVTRADKTSLAMLRTLIYNVLE